MHLHTTLTLIPCRGATYSLTLAKLASPAAALRKQHSDNCLAAVLPFAVARNPSLSMVFVYLYMHTYPTNHQFTTNWLFTSKKLP